MVNKINLIGMILAFFTGLGVGAFAIAKRIKPAVKEIISDLVDGMAEDIHPCRLIATIRFGQEENRTIVDMSQYENKGIIGIVVDQTKLATTAEEKDIDGEPTLYPNAVVYKLGDTWLWKVL